jgi:hypoxia up-regulated 1
LFYNMGAAALQISVIRFFNYLQPQKYGGPPKSVPALEVLGKSWDATCGGDALDHILVEYLADQFNVVWHQAFPDKQHDDVRNYPRPMTKLRIQANKVKHVLSANADIPIHMDAVHDDVSLKTHVSRTQLETLAASLIQRATHAPIQAALAVANRTLQDLTAIELIGGGMRIPKIQHEITLLLPSHLDALGLHMNSDESFALGAAFAGANISTAFRVRQVGMTDINPFPIGVSLSNLPTSTTSTTTSSTTDSVDAAWSKTATIFKAFGKVGVKKTIAFTHDHNIHCGLDYISNDLLPVGTELGLVRYNITGVPEFLQELLERNVTGGSNSSNNNTSTSVSVGTIKPKISLQFELSTSGLVALVKAEAAVEETYTVQEEVDDVVEEEEDAGNNSTGTNSSSSSSSMDTNNTTTTVADDDATTNTTTNDSPGNETITVNNKNATSGVPPLKDPKNSTVPPKKKRLVEKVSGLL